MDLNDSQILQNFRSYASKNSALDVQQQNGGIQETSRSATAYNTIKYTRTQQKQTIENKLSRIASVSVVKKEVFIDENSIGQQPVYINVGGDFPTETVYTIPFIENTEIPAWDVVYTSVSKIGVSSDDYIVNAILWERRVEDPLKHTDKYKLLSIGAKTKEKNIVLPSITEDSYVFDRFKNILLQHDFLIGYDISQPKETYTEPNPDLLAYTKPLGYSLIVLRDGHIITQDPIQLQDFRTIDTAYDPPIPWTSSDPGLNLAIDIVPQDFTINVINEPTKTTINKIKGSVTTKLWDSTGDYRSEFYTPTYTYQILRNPPISDFRDPLAAASGSYDTLLKITDITTSQTIVLYRAGLSYGKAGTSFIYNIVDIDGDGKKTFNIQTEFEKPYNINPRKPPNTPLDTDILAYSRPGFGSSFDVSDYILEEIDCKILQRGDEPYTQSTRVDTYIADIQRGVDFTIATTAVDSTNETLPDITVIAATTEATDGFKYATIEPIYPTVLSLPTNTSATIDLQIRAKNTNNFFSSIYGQPKSVIPISPRYLYEPDAATYSESNIENGDTIWFFRQSSQSYYSAPSKNKADTQKLPHWDITTAGYIGRSKELETKQDQVLCIGDIYNLIQKENISITPSLSLTKYVTQLTGEIFTDVQVGCLVTGNGIPPETFVVSISEDRTIVNLTKAPISTITADVSFVYYTYLINSNEIRFDALYTPSDLFPNPKPTPQNENPDPDSRNGRFILDIGIGKPNLIGMILYVITTTNNSDGLTDCIAVDLSKSPPSFSTFQSTYQGETDFVDISVIE